MASNPHIQDQASSKPTPRACVQGYLRALQSEVVSTDGIGPSGFQSNFPTRESHGYETVPTVDAFDLYCFSLVQMAVAECGPAEMGRALLRLAIFEAGKMTQTATLSGYRVGPICARAPQKTARKLKGMARAEVELGAFVFLGHKFWSETLARVIRRADPFST